MKKILAMILCMIMASMSATAVCDVTIDVTEEQFPDYYDNEVLFLKMGDGPDDGVTWHDVSDSDTIADNFEVHYGTPEIVPGAWGLATSFDRTSSELLRKTDTDFSEFLICRGGDCIMEFNALFSSENPGSNVMFAAAGDFAFDQTFGWSLRLQDSASDIFVRVGRTFFGTLAAGCEATLEDVVVTDTFAHYLLHFNLADNNIYLYRDGALVTQSLCAGMPLADSFLQFQESNIQRATIGGYAGSNEISLSTVVIDEFIILDDLSCFELGPRGPADTDGDGVADDVDNCVDVPNAGQEDVDADGLGDVCDSDNDNDGVDDVDDNCPAVPNADQADGDADGLGDLCDSDNDNDGVDDVDDNCPAVPNADQADGDADGLGDLCDSDNDNDGVDDVDDICSGTVLPDSAPSVELKPEHLGDVDGDGVFEEEVDGSVVDSAYTLADTLGCSCGQILELKPGLGKGELRYGCTGATIDLWIAQDGWASS